VRNEDIVATLQYRDPRDNALLFFLFWVRDRYRRERYTVCTAGVSHTCHPTADEANPVTPGHSPDNVGRTPTFLRISSPSRILRDFRGGPRPLLFFFLLGRLRAGSGAQFKASGSCNDILKLGYRVLRRLGQPRAREHPVTGGTSPDGIEQGIRYFQIRGFEAFGEFS